MHKEEIFPFHKDVRLRYKYLPVYILEYSDRQEQ